MRAAKLFFPVLDLFLPQYCCGCGQALSPGEQTLCVHCLSTLPETRFHLHPDNAVSRKLTGRISFENAMACYYFHKSSCLQNIIHHFKYRNKKETALFMGRLMGNILQASPYFKDIEGIVPVPLHPRKQKKRGYNQSEILGRGISEIMKVPVYPHFLKRSEYTRTQTRLNATDRWQNVKKAFSLSASDIPARHLLLIDDVMTSGATLEACATVLNEIKGIKISIAALAMAEDR